MAIPEWTMTPQEFLTGVHNHAVIEKLTPDADYPTHYYAATRTWQGPLRPDYPTARADLLDHLKAIRA